jgi:HEPN domain-containing protein
MSAADPRTWLAYARADLLAGERLEAMADIPRRTVSWHAQQAAEKAIKGVLVADQIEFPFTHDLVARATLVPEARATRRAQHLTTLTRWGAPQRYPVRSRQPTDAEARATIEHARRVVALAAADIEGGLGGEG